MSTPNIPPKRSYDLLSIILVSITIVASMIAYKTLPFNREINGLISVVIAAALAATSALISLFYNNKK
jgi:multisubunit Na+/H+ antiporter MnhB subunit